MAEILGQRDILARRLEAGILETVPSVVLLLNADRQIVHANKALLDILEQDGLDGILGLRPGELFECVHAGESPGGCGTSPACVHCGALQAVLGTASGEVADKEGRVLVRHQGAVKTLNLQVRAVPLTIEEHSFTIVYMQDIAEKKTRELMDNIFLHDALNALNGLVGAASMLHEETVGDQRELSGMILERARHLEREIRSQRMLREAENDNLRPQFEDVHPAAVCERLATLFQSGGYEDACIVCDPCPETPPLRTDSRLLHRVLENLIKNALEASPKGAPVHVGHTIVPEGIRFHVSNQGCIPEHVQSQLFQRAFSTKGPGRGLGTYSVKLLTENYLGGHVDFISDPQSGTVFTVTIPLAPPKSPKDHH